MAAKALGNEICVALAKVGFAIHDVFVDLRVEGLLGRSYAAAEANGIAAVRHFVHGESLGLQPGGDLIDVRLAHAELVAKLRLGEPLMVARGGGSLLCLQQSIQARLLRRRRLEVHGHTMQLHGSRNRTLIVFRLGQRMYRTRQRRYVAGLDGLYDPVLCNLLGLGP